MRIKFVILFSIVYSSIMLAQPVGVDEAKQKALNFLSNQSKVARTRKNTSDKQISLKIVHQAPLDNGCAYYIFNNEAGGFIIVSGDDRAEDILGYSDNGRFDADHIPVNVKGWLNDYAAQIKYIKEHNLTASGTRNSTSRAAISPLLTTTWNQYSPYNLKCPEKNGERCATGCGATAIAQVMYYYRWPHDYTNEIPAYGRSLQYEALPPAKFDWEHMKDSYGDSDTEEEQNAVAELMQYCGHAAHSIYNASGTSTDNIDYPNAFLQLGYSRCVEWRNRGDFSIEQWEKLVYCELAEGRPVLYSGDAYKNGKKRSGHTFVCDGYDGDGLFHINWGWGGQANGYFRLQALNPLIEKANDGKLFRVGYSVNQSVTIGISPTEINREPFNGLDTEWLYLTGEKSDWARIDEQIYDYDRVQGLSNVRVCYRTGLITPYYMYREDGYDTGLGLFRDDEMIDVMVCEEPMSIDAVWSYSCWYLNGLGKDLSDGTYKIKGIGRKHGTQKWYLNRNFNSEWIQLEVCGDKVTARTASAAGQVAVVCIEQVFNNTFMQDKTVRLTVKNIGEARVNQVFILYLDGEDIGNEGLTLMPNETDYVEFVFQAEKGEHHIKIMEADEPAIPLYDDITFFLGDSLDDINPQGDEPVCLSLSSSSTEAGSTWGEGSYKKGVGVQIGAVANDNYVFTHWSDGAGSNPRVVALACDTMLTAHFMEYNKEQKEVGWSITAGRNLFRLSKRIDSMEDVHVNYDGTKFFRSKIQLDVKHGNVSKGFDIDNDVYMNDDINVNMSMVIDFRNDFMAVFANSKTEGRTLLMEGLAWISKISNIHFKKVQVFNEEKENPEWCPYSGWYPYFIMSDDGNLYLRHFSYPRYYTMQSYYDEEGNWKTIEISEKSTSNKAIFERNRHDNILIIGDPDSIIPGINNYTIFPKEIDFGILEYGSDKSETMTISNMGNVPLIFTAICDSSFTEYFDMADRGTETTLAPGATKDLAITCHGIRTGCVASTNIAISSSAADSIVMTKLFVKGMDSEPLIDEKPIALSVDGDAIVVVSTDSFVFTNDRPDIVRVTRGESKTDSIKGESGNYDYLSVYTESKGYLIIKALAEGVATVLVSDIVTGKENTLSITVSEVDNGIEEIMAADKYVSVFSLTGMRVFAGIMTDDVWNKLPAGVYLVNGKKLIKK